MVVDRAGHWQAVVALKAADGVGGQHPIVAGDVRIGKVAELFKLLLQLADVVAARTDRQRVR